MSLLSENNLITDDILFEHGFRKNEYICDDMRYNIGYVPGHFYKEVRIAVKGYKKRSLNFEYPRDFVFSCLCMLDYDPFNQSITLFCDKDSFPNMITMELKYGQNKERVITGLKRISKPGLRVYANALDIPKVLNGLGIAIISTSKGLMTDKEARKQNVGGEVLAYIW